MSCTAALEGSCPGKVGGLQKHSSSPLSSPGRVGNSLSFRETTSPRHHYYLFVNDLHEKEPLPRCQVSSDKAWVRASLCRAEFHSLKALEPFVS